MVLDLYSSALRDPLNQPIRESRMAEILETDQPPYINQVLGRITNEISNPITNGLWKSPRVKGLKNSVRVDTFLADTFQLVNLWISQQEQMDVETARRKGLKGILEPYPFNSNQSGSE